jgi:hypothetical protein
MTDGIVEFIKAQLDLDERIARNAPGEHWEPQTEAWPESPEARVWTESATGREVEVCEAIGVFAAAHIARHDPAAVLVEIEAKRYLLEWCAEVTAHFDWSTLNQPGSLKHDPNARATHTAVVALQSMAAPYAGRPGFKPGWRLP